MCSVGDDTFENESDKIMTKKEAALFSKVCNKCKTEKACIVLRHKDTYCRSCFLNGATHKFKALLGKSRLIRPNDNVLICHKIGHPSTALLHFLRTGLDLNTPKKLRFEPVIIFVEDQLQLREEERCEVLKKVEEEVTSFGFKLRCVSFIQYVLYSKVEIVDSQNLLISGNDKEKLWSVLDKKTIKTNRNDVITLYMRKLLVQAAKDLNCRLVFTPQISVDVASQLLTNISLGRGCHVPIDTGFCDDREEDVMILRPLRLFDMKELAFYNKFNNLEPVFITRHEVNPYSSVQDLMTKFVKDLQENFPATVTTIMKTGDKLALQNATGKTCKFCKGGLPAKESHLTSEESTNFSQIVSTETPDYTVSGQERYRNILKKFDHSTMSNKEYCYACSRILPCITSHESLL